MDTIRNLKKEFRRQAILARRAVSTDRREEAEKRITANVSELLKTKEICRLYLYASTQEEADTDGIFAEVIRSVPEVFYPRVYGEEMHFFRVFDLKELQPGYRGIREPDAKLPPADERSDKDAMIIVPGCAFTRGGKRMGYGGGFYDRYLGDHPSLYKVGICYLEQIYDTFPSEEHDILMDEVIFY